MMSDDDTLDAATSLGSGELHTDQPANDDDGDVDLDAVDAAIDQESSGDQENDQDVDQDASLLERALRRTPSAVGTLYVASMALFLWSLSNGLEGLYRNNPIFILVGAFLLSLGGAIDYYVNRVKA